MSSTRIRGLLRSDSGHGGVAMISSGESIADDGGGGGGGGEAGWGRGRRRKGGSGGGGSTDSLLAIMQTRTHFDDDDDDDEEEEDEKAGDGGIEAAAAKGDPPAAVAAAGEVVPRPTAARSGICAGLATGTPSTRRRHRQHRSRGSNSSLTSVESLGIVAAAAPAGPPAAAAAAGTGVVARAVARVEDGPADETVRAILAKAKAKQIAEDAVVVRARKKKTVVVAPTKANDAVGGSPRPPPPPYAGTAFSAAAHAARENRERAKGATPQEPFGGADGFIAKLGGFDSSSSSAAASPQERSPAAGAAASNPRDGGKKSDPALLSEGGGGAHSSAGGGSGSGIAIAPAAPTPAVVVVAEAGKSVPGASSTLSQPAAPAPAPAAPELPGIPPLEEQRAARTAQSPLPSPGGSDFSAVSDKLLTAGWRGAGPSKYGATTTTTRDRPSVGAAAEGGGVVEPPTAVVVVSAGERGRPETKLVRLPGAARGDNSGSRHAPAQSSSPSSSSNNNNNNDGVSDGPDDGGAGFLSNVEALAAVAKAVRSMSSIDLPAAVAKAEEEATAAAAVAVEKPSAAAMAAIAAGTAPVKWGPEGAAERRAAAAADGDVPPDLGPLARHDRRGSGSSNGGSNGGVGSGIVSGSNNSNRTTHGPGGSDNGNGSGSGTHAFFTGRLETGDSSYQIHEGREVGEHRLPGKKMPPRAASSGTSDAGTHNITPLPPPSYEAAEEAARLGITPHAAGWVPEQEGGTKLFAGFPDEEGSTASWPPGRDAGGGEETRRHCRRASDGSVRYEEEEAGGGELSREGSGGGVERGILRTSSLMTLKQRRKQRRRRQQQLQQQQPPRQVEVFLDNEEGEWGQVPTSRFWRLRWPGRSRHVPIGVCLDSPKLARASLGPRSDEELARFAWDKDEEEQEGGGGGGGSDADDCASGVGSDRRVDPRFFFSTGSEPPMFASTDMPLSQSYGPLSALEPAERRARRAGAGVEQFATTADVGCFQRSHSSKAILHARGRGGGGGGGTGDGGEKRLRRRWVNGRRSGGGGVGDAVAVAVAVPSEESVEKWMRAVLGPRALGLLDKGGGRQGQDGGKFGLAEELKDGRLLVRLAHAVGGARAAGMAEDLEASTPMMQLVNVHAFMAAARAIGVPAASLFHAKDLVDAAPGGPCSPEVLGCIAALNDAVRRNATTDPPGDVYDGPLLGADEADEQLRPAKIIEEDDETGGGGGSGGDGDGDGSVLSGLASKVPSAGGSAGAGFGGAGSDGSRSTGIGEAMRHELGEESAATSPDSSTLSVIAEASAAFSLTTGRQTGSGYGTRCYNGKNDSNAYLDVLSFTPPAPWQA